MFTRRDFLSTSVASLALMPGVRRPAVERCVFVVLTGGPSHLDTFDPKPDAPAEVRGPFRPIRTCVPGLIVSELLPQLAARADRVAFVRSVYHIEPPLHEVGLQLVQTGRFAARGPESPHVGARLAAACGRPWCILPEPVGGLGLDIGCGQCLGSGVRAGSVSDGPEHSGPSLTLPARTTRPSNFIANCRRAVQLVEAGAVCVVVNQFTGVFDAPSWDCHADGGRLAATFDDYRATVAPAFDRGFALLIDGLAERGLLDSTLVVAAGELGRTPFVNPHGGRDHWAGCWSVLFAGGGVRGGTVLGASDALGGEPTDRPVPAAAIAATVLHAAGVHSDTPAEPLRDLFG